MMSIRDGDRLPHRRILTGSNLMIMGDRRKGKGYNSFINVLKGLTLIIHLFLKMMLMIRRSNSYEI